MMKLIGFFEFLLIFAMLRVILDGKRRILNDE